MAAPRIRRNDTGLVRPYRAKPADFRERYIEMGWDGIDEHYRTNWRVIRRWINEEGREELAAARAAHVRAKQRAEQSRRRRYVDGRTLTPKKVGHVLTAQLSPRQKGSGGAPSYGADVLFDLAVDSPDTGEPDNSRCRRWPTGRG
jgi:hypothetical protein